MPPAAPAHQGWPWSAETAGYADLSAARGRRSRPRARGGLPSGRQHGTLAPPPSQRAGARRRRDLDPGDAAGVAAVARVGAPASRWMKNGSDGSAIAVATPGQLRAQARALDRAQLGARARSPRPHVVDGDDPAHQALAAARDARRERRGPSALRSASAWSATAISSR
jgi:hypothetical protein